MVSQSAARSPSSTSSPNSKKVKSSPAMEKGKKLRDILAVQPKPVSSELRSKQEKTVLENRSENKENIKIANNEDTIITPLLKEPRTPIGAERVKPKPVEDAVDFTAFYQRRLNIPQFIIQEFLSELQIC